MDDLEIISVIAESLLRLMAKPADEIEEIPEAAKEARKRRIINRRIDFRE